MKFIGPITSDQDAVTKEYVDSKYFGTSDSASAELDDADYVPFYDSSEELKKKSLWSTIKSTLKTYFDTFYSALRLMSDVDIVNPADGQFLMYDATQNKWINASTYMSVFVSDKTSLLTNPTTSCTITDSNINADSLVEGCCEQCDSSGNLLSTQVSHICTSIVIDGTNHTATLNFPAIPVGSYYRFAVKITNTLPSISGSRNYAIPVDPTSIPVADGSMWISTD